MLRAGFHDTQLKLEMEQTQGRAVVETEALESKWLSVFVFTELRGGRLCRR